MSCTFDFAKTAQVYYTIKSTSLKHYKQLIPFSVLLVGLLYSSCSGFNSETNNNPNAAKPNDLIDIKVDESKSFSWPEGLQIERITFLETGEGNLISFFRKLIVSPDEKLFYIVDQSQGKILVFESTGTAKDILARQGECLKNICR